MSIVSRSAARGFIVAVTGSVIAWALFLSYGAHSYAVWQIAGAALLVIVAGVCSVAASAGRVVPAVAGLTLGMVVPWTVAAARSDVTGLYLVGAGLLTVGMLAASVVVALGARTLLSRLPSARRSR